MSAPANAAPRARRGLRPGLALLTGLGLLVACTGPPASDAPRPGDGPADAASPALPGPGPGTAAVPGSPGPDPASTAGAPGRRGTVTPVAAPPPPRPAAFDLGDPATPLTGRLPDLSGEQIHILGPEVGAEAASFRAGLAPFQAATGAAVRYEGTPDDTRILAERLAAGNPPDLAVIAQPGRMLDLAAHRHALPVPASIATVVRADYDPFWSEMATRLNRLYGVPNGASVKSLVWYSPRLFADFGYRVPATWAELTGLTADLRAAGQAPWCIGISSGEASGWPFTDWVEDVLLRLSGPQVYDAWSAHEIPFHDPRVAEAVALVSDIWFREGNVLGGRDAIVRTSFADAGLPVLDGGCFLHRQGSFYATNYLDAGARIAADGDVDAFYLPTMTDEFGTVVLGAGNFLTAFTDREATYAALAWVASPEYANARIASGRGGFVSPNLRHDTTLYAADIDRRVAEILVTADPFRFDASDLMPAEVGAGEFWRAATAYVNGTIDLDDLLDRVEAAWPR